MNIYDYVPQIEECRTKLDCWSLPLEAEGHGPEQEDKNGTTRMRRRDVDGSNISEESNFTKKN